MYEETIGHHKKTRIKGTDEFTELKTWSLKPKGKIQFTKPIVILTSDFTASVAEVFILAMKQFPRVTIVGQTSEGIFSDMMEFKLPNGWQCSLSNMKFYDVKMNDFEGIGFVPEPENQVSNTNKDLETGIDPMITRAIEVLKERIE